jgi:hypothetical protein
MIPVFIMARDRFTCLKKTVEYVNKLKDIEVIIIDSASTYPPLLDWYKTKPCRIIYRGRNGGVHAWRKVVPEFLKKERREGYFVLTDPDLELENIPLDILDVLRGGLEKYPEVCKAGLGIKIDDLSSDFPLYKEIMRIEKRFWINKRDDFWFNAGIDTTFAMYRVGGECEGLGIRANYPYVCRHLSWYLDLNNIPEDELYYLKYIKHNSTYWSYFSRYHIKDFFKENK